MINWFLSLILILESDLTDTDILVITIVSILAALIILLAIVPPIVRFIKSFF
ncbi:MAG: hypothetical protein LBV58_00170 [Acholeplasmatales bacterium]|nr:hypothetical protein [Acholeplasmatales bacterium]